MNSLNDRARLRLRDEMRRRHLSQREVSQLIEWPQSRVAQKITGRTPLTLSELEALCFATGLNPVEAVRDHGLEFCADMAPIELRILERFRQLKPAERDAIMTILHVSAKTRLEERGATSSAKKLRAR